MSLSDENQNFFRLYFVLSHYGSKALNEVIHHLVKKSLPPSTTFDQFLVVPSVKHDLTRWLDHQQQQLLYPTCSPSTLLSFGDLDISLASKVLRNVRLFSSHLLQQADPSCPPTLWTDPSASDQTNSPLEANVTFIRLERNEIMHTSESALPLSEFNTRFDIVKRVVLNVFKAIGSTAITDSEIEGFRTQKLPTNIVDQLKETMKEFMVNQIAQNENIIVQLNSRLVEKTNASKTRSAMLLCCGLLGVFVVVVLLSWVIYNESLSRQMLSKITEKFNYMFSTDEKSHEKVHSQTPGPNLVRVKLTRTRDSQKGTEEYKSHVYKTIFQNKKILPHSSEWQRRHHVFAVIPPPTGPPHGDTANKRTNKEDQKPTSPPTPIGYFSAAVTKAKDLLKSKVGFLFGNKICLEDSQNQNYNQMKDEVENPEKAARPPSAPTRFEL